MTAVKDRRLKQNKLKVIEEEQSNSSNNSSFEDATNGARYKVTKKLKQYESEQRAMEHQRDLLNSKRIVASKKQKMKAKQTNMPMFTEYQRTKD